MRYDRPQSDEWVTPVQTGYRMACCDCGLVHEMDFRVVKGKAQFRVRRNNRATAAMRRTPHACQPLSVTVSGRE